MARIAARLPLLGEGAYVEDITGTTYALTASAVSLGLSVSIPQSTRPIWIEAEGLVNVTTIALATTSGTATFVVVDNQGSPVTVGASVASFESADTNPFVPVRVRCRIAPNTPARVYTLQASRGGNSSFRARVMNGAIAPAFRTYLTWRYA